FPPLEFNGAELQEHRLTLPSETLAAYRALQPVLIVRDDDGDMKVQGLCPIRLRPTWNSTHTWAKHSLRDVCRPNRVDFRFTAPPACDATNVAFTGEVECGEDIMSVEIVEDETEMYAVDPENEYTPRADEVYLRVSWNSLKRISPFHMQISVKNGELRYFRDQHRDGNPYEERYRRVSPSILETSMGGRQTTRGVLMIATNKRQSTLVFKTNFCKYEISAARIAQEGLHIANFENGFVLTIETPRHLMDNPMPIRQRRSTFRASFPRLNPEGVYHLRVVTASGKVYRSRPLLVPLPKPESRTTINVYSETQTGVVPVTVQTAWLPDITYRFTPQYGGVLPTSAGYSRYGILGGGLTSGGPFNSEAGGEYYPPDAVISAPRWMEEDGMACLKFDGKGNYIWFPLGVLPMGEFTLEFEIKPLSAKPQIVFKARGHDDGQLTLYLENGKLWGVFNGRLRESDPEFRGNSYVQKHTKNLRPNIDVPLGEWSRVRVTYNLKEFVFSVNGKDAPPIPYDRRASCLFSSFVFGGHGKYKGDFCFFDGYLRALRIRHYAVPAPDKGKVE
ncbi:MAG: LamG-like jellyroll fold domain-containing protein, partial [Kiritimatiellia bacterium]|nr:LamG-like jellyroll fold domain-containing protein [Kiritimatiellia bacterium]